VDRGKTIHFLSEAARQASNAAAHEEALDYLDKAVSLLDEERTVRAQECTGQHHPYDAPAIRAQSHPHTDFTCPPLHHVRQHSEQSYGSHHKPQDPKSVVRVATSPCCWKSVLTTLL